MDPWIVLIDGYTDPLGAAHVVNDQIEVTTAWTDDQMFQLIADEEANHVQRPLDGGLPVGRPLPPMKQV